MKKWFTTLGLIVMTGSLLQAYSDLDRIHDMQAMEVAMSQIQKGILYNNKSLVAQGADILVKSASKVEIPKKDVMDYNHAFAKQKAANISKFAKKVKEEMNAGHKHGATANYTKVLNQCVSCHNKIRKWNP